MKACLATINMRHRAASAVLAALMIKGRNAAPDKTPDFGAIYGLLNYIDQVVRARHFKDEEQLILKPLAKYAPDCRSLQFRASGTYVGASGYSFRLNEAARHWSKGWEQAVSAYNANARDYWQTLRSHGRLLRTQIFPAAATYLPASHWNMVREALAQRPDPVASATNRREREAALGHYMKQAA